MITLYDLPVSSYGCKIRIVLRHKKIRYNSVKPPDGYGSLAYQNIVPSGTIPAIDHNGLILAESEAIAEYLNEIQPKPPMLPAKIEDRAQARMLSRFHDFNLEPLIRNFFSQVPSSGRDPDFITKNARTLQTRINQFAKMANPKPLLTGSNLAIADCSIVPSFVILRCLQEHLDFQIEIPAHLVKYEKELNSHPSVTKEYHSYEVTIRDWANSKKDN